MLHSAGKRDVTPASTPSLGAGPGRGVASSDTLELNCIALRAASNGQPVLLMAADTLYCPPNLRDVLAAEFNLPRANIFIAASHTHQAPMVDHSKPLLSPLDEEYQAAFLDSAIGLAAETLAKLDLEKSGGVMYGVTQADSSIHRRKWRIVTLDRRMRFMRVVPAPNPKGPRDEAMTVVVGLGRDGPAWVVWNYACHPVAHPEPNQISSHYVGAVRDMLREEFSYPDLPIVFLQGWSGDTRPSASAHPRRFLQVVRRILTGPVFDSMKPRAYEEWTNGLSAHVRNALARLQQLDAETNLVVESKSSPMSQILDDPIPSSDYEIQTLSMPPLMFVAVGAEVVSEYALWLRRQLPDRVCVPIGCSGEVFGYLPTSAMVTQGGYEGKEWTKPFGVGSVRNDCEANFKTALSQVLPVKK